MRIISTPFYPMLVFICSKCTIVSCYVGVLTKSMAHFHQDYSVFLVQKKPHIGMDSTEDR